MTNSMLAVAIIREILDKGLAKSTWRDSHSRAYQELLSFRRDMEKSALKILDKELIK